MQNLWDAARVVPRGKFLAIQKPTSRKKEQSEINHLKPDSSGKKERGLP